MAALRWGICGSGSICSDFTVAMSNLPSTDHQVVAIAARSADSASSFAKQYNIPKWFAKYDEMFACADVDVVYIGVINAGHKSCVLDALDAGKHVLCEKPLGLNAADVREMVQKARSKKLFLMEGYWSRFFPAYQQAKSHIAAGAIGTPRLLSANFGYATLDESILDAKNKGSLYMSLGVYLPMFASWLWPNERLESLHVSCAKTDAGVDHSVAIRMHFSGEGTAQLFVTGLAELPCDVLIAGTNGSAIHIPDHCWCPTKLVVCGQTHTFELPKPNVPPNFPNTAGLSYEAEMVRVCLKKGLTECPEMCLDEIVKLAEWNDLIRSKMGLAF